VEQRHRDQRRLVGVAGQLAALPLNLSIKSR
jgi:hypothetical protein